MYDEIEYVKCNFKTLLRVKKNVNAQAWFKLVTYIVNRMFYR